MLYFDVINILIASLFICFMFIIFKIFFFDRIYPNRTVDGCYGNNCKSPRCIGYNCQVKSCTGDNCEGGYCVGENCKAGDCIGTGCKAGDCYGYGCKPGVCFDPLCKYETCPQTNKKCTDGQAKRIENSFFLKNKNYFPNATTMNPPLCIPNVTLNDILIGRADRLNIKKTYFNDKRTVGVKEADNKHVIIETEPKIFKNLNCELCINGSGITKCHNYSPIINKNGQIEWK